MRYSTAILAILPALAVAQTTAFDASAVLASVESMLGTNTAYDGLLSSAVSVIATDPAAISQYSSYISQYESEVSALTGGGTISLPGATAATTTAGTTGAAQATATGTSGALSDLHNVDSGLLWLACGWVLGTVFVL